MAWEPVEREEVQKRSASLNDENGHEHKPKRYRLSLSEFDLTQRLSFAEST